MMNGRRGLALVLLSLAATAAVAQQYTRIPASQFVSDPAKVAALQKAVATMMSRNSATQTTPDFRTSWTYWSATHGYLGTGGRAATTAALFKASAPRRCKNAVPYNTCLSYYDHVSDLTVPNDGITQDVWGTCQHSGRTTVNLQFLPWHRIYLIFFERVMRQASGDPNFALPYWDYYNELGPQNGVAIPQLVRGASTGSLYDQFRTPGLNDNTTSIDPDWASAEQAFDFPDDFYSFSKQLEQQPHGLMHCGSGFDCQAPDMGIVPVAGLDPVFYMHHANIDRLWQCWMLQLSNGAPITLQWAQANLGVDQSWFDQRWYFVDQNGASISMQVKDLFAPGAIDYTYASYNNCGQGPPPAPPTAAMLRAAPAPPPPSAAAAHAAPAAVGKATKLHGSEVTVHPNRVRTLAAIAEPALPAGTHIKSGRALLLLDDVRFDGPPGVTYDVYIAARKTPARRAYIATLNLFGLFEHHDHEEAAATPGFDVLYWDITDELARLALTPSSDIVVTFVPNTGRQHARVTAANAASTVTVGNVRIQQAQ